MTRENSHHQDVPASFEHAGYPRVPDSIETVSNAELGNEPIEAAMHESREGRFRIQHLRALFGLPDRVLGIVNRRIVIRGRKGRAFNQACETRVLDFQSS